MPNAARPALPVCSWGWAARRWPAPSSKCRIDGLTLPSTWRQLQAGSQDPAAIRTEPGLGVWSNCSMTQSPATLSPCCGTPPALPEPWPRLQLLPSWAAAWCSMNSGRTALHRPISSGQRALLLKTWRDCFAESPSRSRRLVCLQAVPTSKLDPGPRWRLASGAGWRRQLEQGRRRPWRSCGSLPLPGYSGGHGTDSGYRPCKRPPPQQTAPRGGPPPPQSPPKNPPPGGGPPPRGPPP